MRKTSVVALALTAVLAPGLLSASVLAGSLAADSMVLLKNEGVLPFPAGARIELVGGRAGEYLKGGTGSADVKSPYEVTVDAGLEAAGFALVSDGADAAVYVVSRPSGETFDRNRADFDFTREEVESIETLGARFRGKLAVVLNIGGAMNLKPLEKSPNVGAILLAYYPGQEGGRAIADVLSGRVNPSGRLAETFARRLSDYPSDSSFEEMRMVVPFEEDIFVGYRYFETVPGGRDRVVYPFGHGLSYTDFRISGLKVGRSGNRITASAEVTNVGDVAGRRSVLVYVSNVGGEAEHPALELKAYAKTSLLKPGERETLSFEIPESELAYFADEGPRSGSWVLDKGKYQIRIGGSVRETEVAGAFEVPSPVVLSSPGLVSGMGCLAKRMRADGSRRELPVVYNGSAGRSEQAAFPAKVPERPIMLSDVMSGRATLDGFVDQLTLDEMLHLCQGQPPAFPRGTAGIGNLPKYGVTNPQTADGPSGIRRSVPSTCFPCPALVACAFDPDVNFRVGEGIGVEARESNIDVMLAPGLNTRRHPLCGRNFEYFSEDPLVSGKCAAAFVRGMESTGTAATIKHFAANCREWVRLGYSDIISERALREIYLKGFEIAVKEGRPRCLMTCYNRINGIHVNSNYNLLTRVLRGEWGFDGLVMTDWRATSRLVEEIAAGNAIKMPIADDGELALAKKQALRNHLATEALRERVKEVLSFVMTTRRQKNGDFGRIHGIAANGETKIRAWESAAISCGGTDSRSFDGYGLCHVNLGVDKSRRDIGLYYEVDVAEAGNYRFSIVHCAEREGVRFELCEDGRSLATVPADAPADRLSSTDAVPIRLKGGRQTLLLIVRNGALFSGAAIAELAFVRTE